MRAAVVLAVALLAAGCEPAPPPPRKGNIADDVPEVTTPVPPTPQLKVGDVIPPLEVKGWINGPPPAVGAPGQKLLLVDVWAEWCPFCKNSAPQLVRLYEKYSSRGVQFVGLTNMPDDMVGQYVSRARIPWANGYLMSTDTIIRLGVGTGMRGVGYQVAPTIYLVGPDGVVRWTDQRMRMNHTPPRDWNKIVDAAIAAQLDALEKP
ncbi:TlpA family protein disulfide reductase [Urbifossiella limnaea]|uniref:Thiol:disulfide interchange protein DsbE n=1 Tax=Urbifossiella limnaea TaxID=2528023 RepID=A0A517XX62_9BACT|nr:TlpA disulfide reductase family protein [Urbifossiella limnaea]QDU22101.1 Thiol:disulfide interchange protein DsbE [Urbifossiella limnaea]